MKDEIIKAKYLANEYYEGKEGLIIVKLDKKTINRIKYNKDTYFDGIKVWEKYKISSVKNGIVFGVVNSIGDRSNGWARINYYIAVDIKKKIVIGALHRESGWHGSFGEKVSIWKKKILYNNLEEVKNER